MVTRRWGTPPMAPAGAAPAARRAKPPTGYAAKTKTAPAIDGRLNDEVWAGAPILRLARTLDGAGRPAQPTEVRLLRDDKALYVAVRCTEPQTDRVRASRGSHDGPIWSDDSIEIFLGVGGVYYHFGVNAAGSTYDGKAKDSTWNVGRGFVAAAVRGKGRWILELSIPLAPMVGEGDLPTEWTANFCRNRYVTGRMQEAAWSPTFSGNSHLPERFGRLLFRDPPKETPGKPVKKGAVQVLPAAEGEGVIRFDLSALPRNARIYRADLRITRTAAVNGQHDEALVNIEVHPLFVPFASGGKAAAAGKPLAIRGPWFDCLDATDAVRQWASGKPNGGFFVKACPFLDAPATCLDIAYEGEPEKVPPPVTDVKAFHRAGQTFLTWKEIRDPVGRDEINWGALKRILGDLDLKGLLRYCVYRSDRPITAESLPRAERIATVRPCSAWNLNGRSVERGIDWHLANRYALVHGHWNPFCRATQDGEFGRDCPMDRLVIRDGAAPLLRATGLYVHTVAAGGRAYYAVLTRLDGVQNTVEISARNTAGPVTEAPGEPEPVLQRTLPKQPYWNYREKRLHYVRWAAPPYVNLPSEYYNWAVAVPLVKLADKHPLELSLHRDDRSYWRTQYRVERDSVVVSPHDFPFPTWWYGYHEAYGTLRSFRQGAIHPYTERRVLWFLDWVARKWPVDRSRILVTSVHRVAGGPGPGGRGGGCSGALHLGFRHPGVFNMVLPGKAVCCDYSAAPHGTMQALWGKVAWGLKTDAGRNVWDELDLVKVVRAYPPARELPLVTLTGRAVPRRLSAFVGALLEKGHAAMLFFDEWGGPKLLPVSASGTWPGNMIRLDARQGRLMPTFGRSQAGAFSRGEVRYTRLNLGYRWNGDDVVDKPDRAEVTIWRTGPRAGPATDVTLRRMRRFRVSPGQKLAWTLGERSGTTTADEFGLITIPATIPEKPTRLIVTRK